LWRFLRPRCCIFGAQEKGWVLSHWDGELQTVIDEFSFPKKMVNCYSSVGAVMDLVFLALDQGLAKVS